MIAAYEDIEDIRHTISKQYKQQHSSLTENRTICFLIYQVTEKSNCAVFHFPFKETCPYPNVQVEWYLPIRYTDVLALGTYDLI